MASRAVVFRPVNTDDVSKTPFEANTTFKYSDADVDVVNKIVVRHGLHNNQITPISASNLSASKDKLTSPHHTDSSVIASRTIKRSIGERPVNSPVLMFIAPVDVKVACPFSIEMLANSSGLKFQCAVAFFIPKSEMVALFARLPVSVIIVFSIGFIAGKGKD